jgi:hypothetical protein
MQVQMNRHRFAWKTISFPECSLQRMILMLVNAVFKNGIRGSAGMFYLTSSGSKLRCWGQNGRKTNKWEISRHTPGALILLGRTSYPPTCYQIGSMMTPSVYETTHHHTWHPYFTTVYHDN